MKTYKCKLLTISVCIMLVCGILFPGSVNSQSSDITRKKVAFTFGMGLVTGNEYGSSFKSTFSNASGFFSWINVDMGLEVNAFSHFTIAPSMKSLLGKVKVEDSYFDNYSTDRYNSIFLPGLVGKYYFSDKGNTSFYISAGAFMSICSSGFEKFEYKANGLAKEATIGYEFTDRYKQKAGKQVRAGSTGFKAGYMLVPVKLFKVGSDAQTKDFGGYSFTLTRTF